MKTKIIISFIIGLFSLNYCYSQIDTLKSIYEFRAPSNNPWGLKYDGENLWVGDKGGKIYKTNTTGTVLDSITIKNAIIFGIAFVDNDLWVVNSKVIGDTIINTATYPIYSLYKINKSNGQKLDSINLISPASNLESGDLWGMCYYKSKLYVSYDGGLGPCLFEINIATKECSNLCCTHSCGMATINDSIWAIRENGIGGTGNYISKINSTQTGEELKYKLNFLATDLTYDGQNVWVIDNDSKKVKKLDLSMTSDLKTINIINENQIELYPNPTEDRIIIKNELSAIGVLSIDITYISGHLIKQIKNNSTNIDLVGIIPGTYFINFKLNNNQQITKKMIKK